MCNGVTIERSLIRLEGRGDKDDLDCNTSGRVETENNRQRERGWLVKTTAQEK